jgi:fermentation-respiration switch protein FrsA (DUF1100 family)
MGRSVVVSAAVVATLILILLAVLWFFQRRLIYFPEAASVPAAGTVLPGARDVTLDTRDGLELGGWLVPPSRGDREMTVLIANGNAGSRVGRAPLAEALARHGFQVLAFDYRGYGGNPGSPSEEGLVLDARAAYDFLVGEVGVPPSRLIFFGESLGGGVLTGLAVSSAPAGMVLRSPFTSLADVGQHHYPLLPVRLLLKDDFPVVEQVSRLEVPVSVVYGSEDTVVPPEQSREVADSAAVLWRLVEVTGADHNDARLVHGPQVIRAVVDLAEHLADPSASRSLSPPS